MTSAQPCIWSFKRPDTASERSLLSQRQLPEVDFSLFMTLNEAERGFVQTNRTTCYPRRSDVTLCPHPRSKRRTALGSVSTVPTPLSRTSQLYKKTQRQGSRGRHC